MEINMNKKALLEYALFARKELETQITLSLNEIGIYDNKIARANIVGEYTIIEGIQQSFPKRLYGLRERMIDSNFKDAIFSNIVEEFAYTWFNRIIAIRFMEVHDYFPHGFRVLTSRDGSYEPEILKSLPYVKDELGLDLTLCQTLREQGKTEDLYRYVLFQQCRTLGKIIPLLFDDKDEYLELVLPKNLLSKDSVIRKIECIPEKDFLNDVEIVGWLYQFYVAGNREEYRHLKTVTKETLPTLSQVFTPDWIVRYLSQNSLGKLWLDNNTSSTLSNQMPFLIKSKKVLEKNNFQIENIKVLEPCCGSGHILVYLFDLLFEMYKEKGYEKSEIPQLIFKNNLVGFDIDKRAVQLSQFSLLMKARSIDKRFFLKGREVIPNVFEIQDSKLLVDLDYKKYLISLPLQKGTKDTIEYLVNVYSNAKIIGSLLKIKKLDYQAVRCDIQSLQKKYIPNILEMPFFEYGLLRIINLCTFSSFLCNQYDVLITNPPYCGISKMEPEEKLYFSKMYPNSKNDLFAMFMDTDFLKPDGILAIVNPDSWMFLSSFQNLREELLKSKSILTLSQIGLGAFDATVQTTMFVLINKKDVTGTFFKLDSNKKDEKETVLLSEIANEESQKRFTSSSKFFSTIPGKQIAYWVKNTDIFTYSSISKEFVSGGRNKTHDNEKYVRYWWEVNDFDRWQPYANGGDFRRWYGNRIYVVDWSKEARNSYDSHGGLYNNKFWGKEGVCWNLITSYKNSFRLKTPDEHFSSASPTIISNNHISDLLVLGFLNTEVAAYLLNILNPTLNTTVGDVLSLPYFDGGKSDEIIKLVERNIQLTKEDWDDCELSKDFLVHPLINGNSIKETFDCYSKICCDRFNELKANEQELNDIFSKALELNDISFTVLDRDISIRIPTQEDASKSLISFLIGVCLGRFKLPNKDTCNIFSDGIAPIFKFVGIEMGLTNQIVSLIVSIYGKESLNENLDFLSTGLGKKPSESPIECINRYLNDTFYSDHVRLYQKRPIYWMLSSGKKGAFKSLIYICKYTANTLASINRNHLLPRIVLYKAEHERLLDKSKSLSLDEREKSKLEIKMKEVSDCEQELYLYGQVFDHVSNKYIDIDLNKGIKSNYLVFQNVSLVVDGLSIKKNLLEPLGIENEKKV